MRILLIEDHQRLAGSIVEGLAGFGFGIDTFATAAEGLAALRSISYDAVILDLGLPDRDGLDLLKDIRATANWTPVIVLTARDGIDDRVEGLDRGADDYMLKPFAMKELAARLRALLRRPGGPSGHHHRYRQHHFGHLGTPAEGRWPHGRNSSSRAGCARAFDAPSRSGGPETTV